MPRPKGSKNNVTKEARETLTELFNGELKHVQTALNEVREHSPSKYLELLSKFMPYWLPKMTEIEINPPDEIGSKPPTWFEDVQ
jgi:hypothetical protein